MPEAGRKLEPAGQARRLLPAAPASRHRRHPRSTRWPAPATSCGSSTPASPASRTLDGDAQLRAALAAAVRQRARARGPLPPERPGHGGRPAALRHRPGRDRHAAGGWRDGQGERRRAARRAQRRGRRPRPVDAALAALARRPALGARVGRRGRSAASTWRPARVETVAELPGFTRGLAFAGPYAFVGLSQVRESNVFGGIAARPSGSQERLCGVWVVDLRSGEIVGFVRFEARSRRSSTSQLLPGIRYPEIAEPDSDLVAGAFALPGGAGGGGREPRRLGGLRFVSVLAPSRGSSGGGADGTPGSGLSMPRLTPPATSSASIRLHRSTTFSQGERQYGLRRSQPAILRGDSAAGCVVGAAAGRLPRALHLHRLRDLGGVPGRALPLRHLPLAVLFARALRRSARPAGSAASRGGGRG